MILKQLERTHWNRKKNGARSSDQLQGASLQTEAMGLDGSGNGNGQWENSDEQE